MEAEVIPALVVWRRSSGKRKIQKKVPDSHSFLRADKRSGDEGNFRLDVFPVQSVHSAVELSDCKRCCQQRL